MRNSAIRHNVIIIGGGPAGISALIQIVNSCIERKFKNISIIVVEKSADVGPGLPFSTSEPVHILNLPAEIMSPDPKNPTLFINWLKENPKKWGPLYPEIDIEKTKFPPRSLYGLFLKELAKE